ncbi:MAG: DUF4157 domain-containing protein, partial [Cyanobacteria bacterium P01_E01_bin.42]
PPAREAQRAESTNLNQVNLATRPFVTSENAVQAKTEANTTTPEALELKSGSAIANINRSLESGVSPLPPRPPAGLGNIQPKLQAKLTIGAPGDKYEREADHVARDVVQKLHSSSTASTPTGTIQKRSQSVQRKSTIPRNLFRAQPFRVPDMQADFERFLNRAKGGGTPLDNAFRAKVEPLMGADFSQVKVHSDSSADRLSQSIQAKAFTTGSDIFFRQGQYNPGSRGGQELLTHELTHVVQQTGNIVQRSPLDKLTPEQIEEIERQGGAFIQAKFQTLPQLPDSFIQRAYIGRRPLGGKLSFGDITQDSWFKGLGVFHEHIFFEDGNQPPDIGFGMGDNHIVGQEPDTSLLGTYKKVPKYGSFDDAIMRRAVNAIKDNIGTYSILYNNCQDFVKQAIEKYEELNLDTIIEDVLTEMD